MAAGKVGRKESDSTKRQNLTQRFSVSFVAGAGNKRSRVQSGGEP